MTTVKTLAAAAVLALVATGPAIACSYSKQDTTAEAPKPAEVAAAPAQATTAPASTTAAAPTSASTEVAVATQVATPTVKPN
jgi:hypothetical protein